MAEIDERLTKVMRRGLAEGRWDEAMVEAQLALMTTPLAPKALLAVAVCHFHKREFTQAITCLDRAARSAERATSEEADGTPWAPIYLFRGLAYAARRLPDAARADLEVLRQLGPTPIRWSAFSGVLRPDELTRAKLAAKAAGLPFE